MRIGYPCINRSLSCSNNKTFRLASYSEERLKETVKNNLECLLRILQFNLEHGLLFFRITSNIVPFASHPVNTFNWQEFFRPDLEKIGDFISRNQMRISMHPDQFTLINSTQEDIFHRSKKELKYHTELLDLMNLDSSAKVQIHIGGVYGDKPKSIQRFVTRLNSLETAIRKRMVIENDDRLFDVVDCLQINSLTHAPVLLDAFHHQLNSKTPLTQDLFELITRTWNCRIDGIPMVDYSSQETAETPVKHAQTIDLDDFGSFLKKTEPNDFDIMLEIKDKEKSALQAKKLAERDMRFRLS